MPPQNQKILYSEFTTLGTKSKIAMLVSTVLIVLGVVIFSQSYDGTHYTNTGIVASVVGFGGCLVLLFAFAMFASAKDIKIALTATTLSVGKQTIEVSKIDPAFGVQEEAEAVTHKVWRRAILTMIIYSLVVVIAAAVAGIWLLPIIILAGAMPRFARPGGILPANPFTGSVAGPIWTPRVYVRLTVNEVPVWLRTKHRKQFSDALSRLLK